MLEISAERGAGVRENAGAERHLTEVLAVSLVPRYRLLTSSLSPFPARNTGATPALIEIARPVRGLRPVRAFRLRVSKLPNPVIWTFLPFLSSEQITPPGANSASTILAASALDLPRLFATASTSSCLFTQGSFLRSGTDRGGGRICGEARKDRKPSPLRLTALECPAIFRRTPNRGGRCIMDRVRVG